MYTQRILYHCYPLFILTQRYCLFWFKLMSSKHFHDLTFNCIFESKEIQIKWEKHTVLQFMCEVLNDYDDGWLGGWVNTRFCHWETGDLRSPNISFGKAASKWKNKFLSIWHLTSQFLRHSCRLEVWVLIISQLPTDRDSLKVTQKMLDDFDT